MQTLIKQPELMFYQPELNPMIDFLQARLKDYEFKSLDEKLNLIVHILQQAINVSSITNVKLDELPEELKEFENEIAVRFAVLFEIINTALDNSYKNIEVGFIVSYSMLNGLTTNDDEHRKIEKIIKNIDVSKQPSTAAEAAVLPSVLAAKLLFPEVKDYGLEILKKMSQITDKSQEMSTYIIDLGLPMDVAYETIRQMTKVIVTKYGIKQILNTKTFKPEIDLKMLLLFEEKVILDILERLKLKNKRYNKQIKKITENAIMHFAKQRFDPEDYDLYPVFTLTLNAILFYLDREAGKVDMDTFPELHKKFKVREITYEEASPLVLSTELTEAAFLKMILTYRRKVQQKEETRPPKNDGNNNPPITFVPGKDILH